MISKELKFLLTHSSIYGMGTVVSQLVSFLLLPVYTRCLTPEDYGILEMLEITTSIIGIFVTIAVAKAMSRFYFDFDSLKERNTVVSTTYITYIIIALCSTPILLATTDFFARIVLDSEKYGSYFTLTFISLLFGVTIDIGLMYLRIIKKPVVFVSITVSRLFMLISLNILFLVYFKMGIIGILYSTLISRVFYAVAVTVPILWKTGARFSLRISLDIMKFGLPLIPAALASTCVKQSDKYFIRYFVSIADTGIYSLALKLGNTIHLLLTMPFVTAYIPRRFEIMNQTNAKEIYSKVFTYYSFFIIYAGLVISILVPEILQIMVTPPFYRAGLFVPLIVLSMIIFGAQQHFDFGILWSKKTKYLAYINFFISLFNVGINFLLIPRWGIWGAVWASNIVLAVHTVCIYWISNKLYTINYEFYRIFKLLFIAVAFYILSIPIDTHSMIVNLLIKTLILSLFPLVTMYLGMYSQQELHKIKSVLDNVSEKYVLLRRPFKVVTSIIK